MNINSRQIEVFLTLAKNCSFSRTAEAMSFTQPTVSRMVKLLETELGVTLFDRNKRNVHITEAGIFWTRRFIRIMKMIEDGKKETWKEKKDA